MTRVASRRGTATVDTVDYLHLELDRHDVVLAEGLPAESWLDTGTRHDFEGSAALTLHPTFAAMAHELACRPFVLVGPEVEAARRAVRQAAVALDRPAVRDAPAAHLAMRDS